MSNKTLTIFYEYIKDHGILTDYIENLYDKAMNRKKQIDISKQQLIILIRNKKTIKEVAGYLNVSKRTVYRLIKKYEIRGDEDEDEDNG